MLWIRLDSRLQSLYVCSRGSHAGKPQRRAIAEENFRKRLRHKCVDPPPHKRLGCVFAGRSTAEVGIGNKHATPLVAPIVKGVFPSSAVVFKRVIAKVFKSNRAQIARRYNAIRIYISTAHGHAAPDNLFSHT